MLKIVVFLVGGDVIDYVGVGFFRWGRGGYRGWGGRGLKSGKGKKVDFLKFK